MAFPKKYAETAARLRVPAGFLVAAVFLLLAQPTPRSFVAGVGIALCGLAIRAWAAGHLRKNLELTVSGPYAYVRNPLYLGSLIVALGCAVAGAHWGVGAVLAGFFVFFYLPVVGEEEGHLGKILPGYAEYRREVPRLRPRIPPYRGEARAFSFTQYRRNREYEALGAFLIVLAVLAAKLWLL